MPDTVQLPDVNVGPEDSGPASDAVDLSPILSLLLSPTTMQGGPSGPTGNPLNFADLLFPQLSSSGMLSQIVNALFNPVSPSAPTYDEGDIIPSQLNKDYGATLDEEAGSWDPSPNRLRELPLLQALGRVQQMKEENPSRDESLTDYFFTNPQYPVTTGKPYQIPLELPTWPTETPMLPPDQLMPKQAQPRFGATPISDITGTADNPLLQLGPEGAVVGSRPVPGSADRNSFFNHNNIAPYNPPSVADDRVNPIALFLRSLLKGVPGLQQTPAPALRKPRRPQDPSQET